jgi:nitrate/nitrite transporter NarK
MARWGGAFSPVIVGNMLRLFDKTAFRNLLAGTPLHNVAPWRFGFWISGLIGVLWVLLFWPFFRDNPANKKSVNQSELDLINQDRPPASVSPSSESHTAPADIFRHLLTSPSLWSLALLYLCVSFGWSFFASWIPRFFEAQHHVTFDRSEWLTTFPLFFGGLSCLAGGALCDYLVKRNPARKRLLRALFPVTGYSLAACAFIALRFARTPQQAAVICCVIAVASDFGQGANWSTIVDIGGRYAGIATGLINTVGNLGHFTQPPLGQWIFHTFGWNALFVVYAAAFGIAASLWLFIDPTRRFYPDQEQPRSHQGFEVLASRR